MDKDWMMVYSTPDEQKANILLSMLEEHGIQAVLMNKTGKPYGILGEVEIYIFWQQAEEAIHLIYANES